jgi:hypothetical protein
MRRGRTSSELCTVVGPPVFSGNLIILAHSAPSVQLFNTSVCYGTLYVSFTWVFSSSVMGKPDQNLMQPNMPPSPTWSARTSPDQCVRRGQVLIRQIRFFRHEYRLGTLTAPVGSSNPTRHTRKSVSIFSDLLRAVTPIRIRKLLDSEPFGAIKAGVIKLRDRPILCLWRLLEAILRLNHPLHTHPDHVSAQFNSSFSMQGAARIDLNIFKIYSYSVAKNMNTVHYKHDTHPEHWIRYGDEYDTPFAVSYSDLSSTAHRWSDAKFLKFSSNQTLLPTCTNSTATRHAKLQLDSQSQPVPMSVGTGSQT